MIHGRVLKALTQQAQVLTLEGAYEVMASRLFKEMFKEVLFAAAMGKTCVNFVIRHENKEQVLAIRSVFSEFGYFIEADSDEVAIMWERNARTGSIFS